MATKKSDSRPRTKPKSNRGGARPGAGRKPKAIVEMRMALIAPLIPEPAKPLTDAKSAAEYALALFEGTMRDESKALDLRLDCAREVLDRTIGKPRIANEPPAASLGEEAGGVHIYIPANGREPQAEACEAEAAG